MTNIPTDPDAMVMALRLKGWRVIRETPAVAGRKRESQPRYVTRSPPGVFNFTDPDGYMTEIGAWQGAARQERTTMGHKPWG